jgi:hypothetical protein
MPVNKWFFVGKGYGRPVNYMHIFYRCWITGLAKRKYQLCNLLRDQNYLIFAMNIGRRIPI